MERSGLLYLFFAHTLCTLSFSFGMYSLLGRCKGCSAVCHMLYVITALHWEGLAPHFIPKSCSAVLALEDCLAGWKTSGGGGGSNDVIRIVVYLA